MTQAKIRPLGVAVSYLFFSVVCDDGRVCCSMFSCFSFSGRLSDAALDSAAGLSPSFPKNPPVLDYLRLLSLTSHVLRSV